MALTRWRPVSACVYGSLLLVAIVHSRLPVPCTDLKPIYLLHMVAPDRHRLPPGVEITYDPEVNLHAFRVTAAAHSLHFPSGRVFLFCEYFPEEFSVLVTLRVAGLGAEPMAEKSRQDILAILDQRHGRHSTPTTGPAYGKTSDNTSGSASASDQPRPRFALSLHKGKVEVSYYDRRSGVVRIVDFHKSALADGGWHTIIVSVTGNKISLREDCGRPRVRRLKRAFPAFLSISNTNFHIANTNNTSTMFTGLLKQLLLLPGTDASAIACPAHDPRIPDISRVPPIGDMNTGQRGRLTMDYVEWYQDLVTAAPTIDIEVFEIPGEGLFMATASYSDSIRELKKQQSTIFKWEDERFMVYQSLYTLGAQGWEHFSIGKQFFLAVANHGPRRDRASKSVIYRWDRKRKRFRLHQELVTWTARDIEYFEIEGQHYLAVANHVSDQNHTIGSDILVWERQKRKFEKTQTILTVGAYDWTHFRLEKYHFLVVANSFSGPPESTTRLKSVIYFWQKGHFIKFQTLETTGATDWEFFTVRGDYYLVVANAFNYGAHVTEDTDRYMTNSTIYRLNKLRKQFEIYQSIVTFSAVDWEAFTVGEDTFLIVSNAQQHGGRASSGLTSGGSSRACREDATWCYSSVIYRWQGVERFVAQHHLVTHSSADWESFTVDGQVYLVYANAKDNVSQVYKVRLR